LVVVAAPLTRAADAPLDDEEEDKPPPSASG